jgi:glycine/D-amino acid oxidase-like deaminating enzyme
MNVAIIGGGVMGCTAALALADGGARVVVLERAVPGA